MKSLIVPSTLCLVLVGAYGFFPEKGLENADVSVASYAFDPSKIRQNVCGPVGSKRGVLFRPDIAHLLSNAVNASENNDETVALIPGLDQRDFPISSENPDAKAYFRQGFALLYGFNHWEAIRAFRKAQMFDPNCAVCYWGEAIAHGPNINAPMDAAANKLALTAIAKAQALKEHASEREAALIDAAALRYSTDTSVVQADLDQKYADAMAVVNSTFPDDLDISTLYAEALMTTSPWDYWERDFSTPKPHIKTALETIEGVLQSNPDHYGAIHLYIHLYEASSIAKKAEPYADKLAGLAPGAGHLVHMPGHIYFRIGRYLDSLKTNVEAVAVDKAYLESTSGSNIYRYGYYPHNVHFVLVSAQMAGDAKTAFEYAERLDQLIPVEVLQEAAWIAPIKAAPYFVHAQFSDVDSVMALPEPMVDIPYLKAIWHFARGLALAEAGDERAEVEKAAIDTLLGEEAITSAGIPAANILKLAGNTIEAKYLMSQNQPKAAISLLEEAVVLQDGMPYTEPPYWYYAVEQSLAAALYQAGRYDDAARAFKASLLRHPNSAWSLYGLWQAQLQLGLEGEAAFTKELWEKASSTKDDISFIKL